MNFSSFDYFIVLARERNFTRAAQQLHITQQSLSSHIASLEEELGCLLLVRHVPLELTYAGTVFLKYAKSIQQELSNMHREFCDITENQKGILRVGIAFTRGRAIMPRLISKFQELYPNIEVHISEAANKALLYNLLEGEIDLAIANFEGTVQDVDLLDFYEENVVLLVENKLMQQLERGNKNIALQISRGDFSGLSSCPFLLGSYDNIAGRIGRTLIEKAGFKPIIKTTSDNIETLLLLCLQGAGACFCPENLAKAVIPPGVFEKINLFHLGEQAQYPIRFGFLKTSYQWKIISEFIRMAQRNIVE